MTVCSICDGTEFDFKPVLWPELIADMELGEEETAMLDQQQGRSCKRCGGNLRLIALGRAIRSHLRFDAPLRQFPSAAAARQVRILDINGGGAVSDALCGASGYVRADYPELRLEAMPFESGSFDLILHTDTLEHVEDPVQCLRECRRVLSVDGALCFTVPILPARLTRNRRGLKPSFHGNSKTRDYDMLVHSEFGADVWTLLFQAGFEDVTLSAVEYPIALALTARAGATDAAEAAARPAQAKAPTQSAAKRAKGLVRSVLKGAGLGGGIYDQDGLRSIHNHDFMAEPAFARAYRRGEKAAADDYRWHWRVHVGLWCAKNAASLPGDFVECGVNRGFMSSAIMEYVNWNALGKTFYLLDTFQGIDDRFVSADERTGAATRNASALKSGFYTTDLEQVRRNFAEWKNTRIIVGAIPETLAGIDAKQIAFLHIDLNCVLPEVAAAEALWDRLVPGACMLLDDYAYRGYEAQKRAMDRFASTRNVSILSLPTGQGLLIRPRPGNATPVSENGDRNP